VTGSDQVHVNKSLRLRRFAEVAQHCTEIFVWCWQYKWRQSGM